MKRTIRISASLTALAAVAVSLTWAFLQTASQPSRPPTELMPQGALLYLEAKDFSGLLKEWEASPEKRAWLTSENYSVFSQSRLFLRLHDAQQEFAAAAGIPPDMNFLNQAAGQQSALAIYDIGKLELLYITRMPSSHSLETQLWQGRGKFEARSVQGAQFFVRTDAQSKRVVAFAVAEDYLILATREDLVAGALEGIAGKSSRTIEQEDWYRSAIASASQPGDLRMVLNLEKIAVTPQFRTYWIQQNITEMQGFTAAISDLRRSSAEYREERTLIRKNGAKLPGDSPSNPATAEGEQAVADLVQLLPSEYGAYRALANPKPEYCLAVLEAKILAPHIGPARAQQLAPGVALGSGETGSSADLETRIDVAPTGHTVSADALDALRQLLQNAAPQAVLQVQSTHKNADGVLMHINTGMVFSATSDWEPQAVRDALQAAIRPGLTASELGVSWQEASTPGSAYYRLDGLNPLLMATRGKQLFIANDPDVMLALLQSKPAGPLQPVAFAAGFRHDRERENFVHLSRVLARSAPNANDSGEPQAHEPDFFAENIDSLSRTLAGVASESVQVHDSGDKVSQTVVYHWSQ